MSAPSSSSSAAAPSEKASLELMNGFMKALQTQNFKAARQLADAILLKEPNNPLVAEFKTVLQQIEDTAQSSSEESGDDSSGTSDSDTGSSSSDSDSTSDTSSSSDSESEPEHPVGFGSSAAPRSSMPAPVSSVPAPSKAAPTSNK